MSQTPDLDNSPVRRVDSIHFIQQPTPMTCGQASSAMLAGVSVSAVCQVMGNDSTTSYEDMTGALEYSHE